MLFSFLKVKLLEDSYVIWYDIINLKVVEVLELVDTRSLYIFKERPYKGKTLCESQTSNFESETLR